MAAVMMVTVRRFLSDGEARKADRQSSRSDKAFDHGSTLPANKRRRSPGVCSNPSNPAREEGGIGDDNDEASGNVEKLVPEPEQSVAVSRECFALMALAGGTDEGGSPRRVS